MTKEELYELIDIDSPEDLTYFEQFADLIECEEDIEEDLIKDALSQISSEDAGTLVENYFEDLTNAVPDDADDLVSLIDSIKQNLALCTEDLDQSANRKKFAELIYSFRQWIHDKKGAKLDGRETSIFNAIAEHRAENVGGESHKYDFTASCSFELEDISLNLGSYEKVDIISDEYYDSKQQIN